MVAFLADSAHSYIHTQEPVHKSQAGTFSCSTTQIPLKLLSEPLPLQSSWGSKGEDAASSRQWLKKHGRLAEVGLYPQQNASVPKSWLTVLH